MLERRYMNREIYRNLNAARYFHYLEPCGTYITPDSAATPTRPTFSLLRPIPSVSPSPALVKDIYGMSQHQVYGHTEDILSASGFGERSADFGWAHPQRDG